MIFRAEPMLRANIWALSSEAADVAVLLAEHAVFNPTTDAGEHFPEASAEHFREIYQEAESRYSKIMESFGRDPHPVALKNAVAPSLQELEKVNAWLKDAWKTCLANSEAETTIADQRKRLATLSDTLERLKSLDIDLARLMKSSGLLDVRLGSVSPANLKRLKESLDIAGYLLSVFDQSDDQVFCVATGPKHATEEVGSVLNSAGWRALEIPAELMAHPDDAAERLKNDTERLAQASAEQCKVRDEIIEGFEERLEEAALQLALARPLAEASTEGVRGRGQLSQLSGWVPRNGLKALETALEERFPGRFVMSTRKPTREELPGTPTLLRHPTWLSHFTELVKSYGVPRYGEFDPSVLFAIAYVFLFGAMFGDVGHGAVLLVGAFFLRGKLAFLRTIGIAAALSAISFGFIYGSIFGFEEIIEPIWQSPLHDPGSLLMLAVKFGVGFIAVTQVINIANLIYFGRYYDALFLPTGVAGLTLYLGMVFGLFSFFGNGSFGLINLLLASSGLLAITVYTWIETSAPIGERLLVTLIESFEAVINLFSATLSFLRVAAFSLNHVALALAVFTMASGLGAAGHWLTLVLGNVVIIVLEGGIVAIQALRLMYYEGFSRFYSGDGLEFNPLRLQQKSDSMRKT